MSSFNWKNEDNTNDPKYSNHLANLVRQTIIIILIVIIAVIMIIITLKMIITVVTMIKNKDYAACVRRESGYCEVEWTTATPYDQQVVWFGLVLPPPMISRSTMSTFYQIAILS